MGALSVASGEASGSGDEAEGGEAVAGVVDGDGEHAARQSTAIRKKIGRNGCEVMVVWIIRRHGVIARAVNL
jgi:hypothetical protein